MKTTRFLMVAVLGAAMLVGGALCLADDPPKKTPQEQEKERAEKAEAKQQSVDERAKKSALRRGQQQQGQSAAKKDKPKKKQPAATQGDASVPRAVSPAVYATRSDPRTGEEVIVITNDDLERTYGKSTAKGGSPDYKAFLEARDAAQKNARGSKPAGKKPKAMSPEQRQQQIAQVRSELDRLKRKLLGLQNPLMPRGKETQEEAARDKGKDNVERVKATKQQIRDLEEKLLKLQSSS